jgi:hypothetical protein
MTHALNPKAFEKVVQAAISVFYFRVLYDIPYWQLFCKHLRAAAAATSRHVELCHWCSNLPSHSLRPVESGGEKMMSKMKKFLYVQWSVGISRGEIFQTSLIKK